MSSVSKLSSFVRLDANEAFERDYYITHTSKRRFTLARVLTLLVVIFVFFVLGGSLLLRALRDGEKGTVLILLPIMIFPPVITLLYFALRPLKISHGYAAITDRRLLYYEFNEHPAVNYQHVKSLHLDDVTGIDFHMERTWFSKTLSLVIYTSRKGMVVGARSFLGWFNFFGSEKILEPGPDALEFIQHMTGAIAARQLQITAGSGKVG